ncbi:hypothetical protein BC835DRAFT_1310219 [Cytidiella melzeri]|nr:hypothetical protein BC835DRAFT_1310219 [Cytidiella melzeri]
MESAVDAVSLLLTCKAINVFMFEETIWRYFCARCGIHNPADLGGTTFFAVYSIILHPYWPLIGLWARDSPYSGLVIEFRIDSERQAIVGESWETMHAHGVTELRITPIYVLFMTISLSPHINTTSPSSHAVISWRLESSGDSKLQPQTDLQGFPALHVLSETRTTLYVRYGLSPGYPKHRAFPDSVQEVWYDRSRGLPRIAIEPSPVVHVYPPELYAPVGRVRIVLPSFANHDVKRMALCIKTADSRSLGMPPTQLDRIRVRLIEDRLGSSADRSPNGVTCRDGRFYPLKSDRQAGQPLTDEDWTPSSLEGLWLGDDRSQPIQVLWFAYDPTERVLNAWKITGDVHLPRGCMPWTLYCDEFEEEHLRDAQLRRRYRVTGVYGSTKRTLRKLSQGSAIVISPDYISLNWPGFICNYRRCPARSPSSEIRLDPFRRYAQVAE